MDTDALVTAITLPVLSYRRAKNDRFQSFPVNKVNIVKFNV